jgi:hypothetical protein
VSPHAKQRGSKRNSVRRVLITKLTFCIVDARLGRIHFDEHVRSTRRLSLVLFSCVALFTHAGHEWRDVIRIGSLEVDMGIL